VFSGRGLCDELITRPEESYRLCCVVVCDLETSRICAPYIYEISSLRVKFPSPKTKFLHMTLSPTSSSVILSLVILHLTPSIRLSLGLHFLRVLVRPGSHSMIFCGNLFPGILFTCPNHRNCLSSVCPNIFVSTSVDYLMVLLVLLCYAVLHCNVPLSKTGGVYIIDIRESMHCDTIMKVTNKMQLYRLIYYSKSALHVSGDVFAHHQERLTVFTVSGSIHPS